MSNKEKYLKNPIIIGLVMGLIMLFIMSLFDLAFDSFSWEKLPLKLAIWSIVGIFNAYLMKWFPSQKTKKSEK